MKRITFGLKGQGKKIVFTNGCFDLLHYGHVRYLELAKSKGDILVVALNSDASAKRIKGKLRPIVNQKNRAQVVAGLSSVDFVTIFNQDTPSRIIKALKPDILIKGADWKNNIVGTDFVCSYGGRTVTIKLVKGLSSTNLIKKIVKNS